MLAIGVLGISHKTADLGLREEIARAALSLGGEKALFFPHPTVLLSTCNRTEIYFSASDLAAAHSDLLAHLRLQIIPAFEHRLYSYFGIDCLAHLCKVAAGLDSPILGESEIQRQVKLAYGSARHLNSCLHFAFQKALKVSKEMRSRLYLQGKAPTLYGALWQLASWKKGKILLVGYSEINRGLVAFLQHKGIEQITLCTRSPERVSIRGVAVADREVLSEWQSFSVIVAASQAGAYLISGTGGKNSVIFDLSVPRNVDPNVEASVYNIEQVNGWIEERRSVQTLEIYENWIWENALRLMQIYALKTQHAPEIAGMGSHL